MPFGRHILSQKLLAYLAWVLVAKLIEGAASRKAQILRCKQNATGKKPFLNLADFLLENCSEA